MTGSTYCQPGHPTSHAAAAARCILTGYGIQTACLPTHERRSAPYRTSQLLLRRTLRILHHRMVRAPYIQLYVPVQLYTVLATSIHFCRTQYSCLYNHLYSCTSTAACTYSAVHVCTGQQQTNKRRRRPTEPPSQQAGPVPEDGAAQYCCDLGSPTRRGRPFPAERPRGRGPRGDSVRRLACTNLGTTTPVHITAAVPCQNGDAG